MPDRDPFDVLGVEPGASSSEIAAAYRKLARRHHPDGHPDDNPQQRARREALMAEINEAHRAIRDGWRRPAAPQGPTRAGPRAPRPPRPTPPQSAPATEPDLTEPPTGDPVSPWRVFAVLGLATAALLAVIAIVVAVISPDSATAPTVDEPALLDVGSWTVGTCVTDGPTAEAVRCEFPHRARVVADVFSAAQCPSSSEAYVVDPPRFLCLDFDS